MTFSWNKQYIIKGKTFFQKFSVPIRHSKFPLFFLFELDSFYIVSIIPFYKNLSNVTGVNKKLSFLRDRNDSFL
ncbi:Uncharacterised protein [Streptococcus pneumoniae]|nr:Uncharacterised protein [Streptococcus pneumoniae]